MALAMRNQKTKGKVYSGRVGNRNKAPTELMLIEERKHPNLYHAVKLLGTRGAGKCVAVVFFALQHDRIGVQKALDRLSELTDFKTMSLRRKRLLLLEKTAGKIRERDRYASTILMEELAKIS